MDARVVNGEVALPAIGARPRTRLASMGRSLQATMEAVKASANPPTMFPPPPVVHRDSRSRGLMRGHTSAPEVRRDSDSCMVSEETLRTSPKGEELIVPPSTEAPKEDVAINPRFQYG